MIVVLGTAFESSVFQNNLCIEKFYFVQLLNRWYWSVWRGNCVNLKMGRLQHES